MSYIAIITNANIMKNLILLLSIYSATIILFILIAGLAKRKSFMAVLNDSATSAILRGVYPGYSYCSGCGLPWNKCESKSVNTSLSNGTFATCIDCWNKLSLDDLKWCYTQAYNMQKKSSSYPMKHTLDHLLKCVEEEFNKTNGTILK